MNTTTRILLLLFILTTYLAPASAQTEDLNITPPQLDKYVPLDSITYTFTANKPVFECALQPSAGTACTIAENNTIIVEIEKQPGEKAYQGLLILSGEGGYVASSQITIRFFDLLRSVWFYTVLFIVAIIYDKRTGLRKKGAK